MSYLIRRADLHADWADLSRLREFVEAAMRRAGRGLGHVAADDDTCDECEAARAAKNAERDAKLAVKNLTREESARLSAAAGERVTTVAAAKALIRQPAETMVELEWNRSAEASSRWESSTRFKEFIANAEARLAREKDAAERAAEILAEREVAAPGTGQTRAESDEAFTRKLRAARREWFR